MPQVAERLKEYHRKRDFGRTLEPAGATAAAGDGHRYVMHKHAARSDHFDLRLEQKGVLRSWALPKGPSLRPGDKRLAIEVEDHPLEYGEFEGVIPPGEYGGGTVMLWDTGEWRTTGKADSDRIDFHLAGKKLEGAWTLVRTRGNGQRAKSGKHWLLIKRSDEPERTLVLDDLSVATGRSMDEIARAAEGSAPPSNASEIPGARRRSMPDAPQAQLATLVDTPPPGGDWVHELKYDGYRILARLENGRARLLTRNGHDWTKRFPEIAAAAEALPPDSAIIDGEAVVMTGDGSSSFRLLQNALSRGKTERVIYQAFDLLYLEGYDLTDAGLLARKQALHPLIDACKDQRIRYSDHLRGQSEAFHREVCELGLEGIVSKHTHAPYRAGRSRRWLKTKCTHHEEFVVGGYTPPGGSRKGFGALLLGAFHNGELLYAGRVGTGFDSAQIDQILALLQARRRRDPPFAGEVPDSRAACWVEPQIVVEVEFTQRTREGRLRHPVFRGLREDRDAEEITLEETTLEEETRMRTMSQQGRSPAGQRGDETRPAGVRISHPDRVMYPEQGVTKLDLARYYVHIREWLLPHLAGRPLSLLRCPQGRQTECFFQKHPGGALAKQVPRIDIEQKKGSRKYVYVESISDVVALVQAGVLEFHPWGSRVEDLERPDIMVFDLDPAPGVSWSKLRQLAQTLRERLDAIGLNSFLRTTGGKGLHLVLPLEPRADWDEVKDFARAVAERTVADDPAHLTANMSKSKRQGKVFIDYLRNGRGSTAIASYSARARRGAPVATPVRWDELGPALRPDRYHVDNLRRRLGALKADPWEGFFDAAVPITARMKKAVGLR